MWYTSLLKGMRHFWGVKKMTHKVCCLRLENQYSCYDSGFWQLLVCLSLFCSVFWALLLCLCLSNTFPDGSCLCLISPRVFSASWFTFSTLPVCLLCFFPLFSCYTVTVFHCCLSLSRLFLGFFWHPAVLLCVCVCVCVFSLAFFFSSVKGHCSKSSFPSILHLVHPPAL